MVRGKARYNRPTDFSELIRLGRAPAPTPFTSNFRNALCKFYHAKKTKRGQLVVGDEEASDFAESQISCASWARDEMDALKLTIKKQDMLAECFDLTRILRTAESQLRSISPDLDCLLRIDIDPRGSADHINELLTTLGKIIANIRSVVPTIERNKRKPSFLSKRNEIATELVVRASEIAKEHEIKIAASANSEMVQMLKLIGDKVGLNLAASTWRDILYRVRKRSQLA